MKKHFYILLLFFTCMQAYGQGMYYVKDTVTAKTNVPDTKILDKLSDKAVVTFRDAPAAKYAFDTYNSVYDKALQIKSSYEHIGSYHVNNKAILPNEKDEVIAKITQGDIDPDKVEFITSKGVKFEAKYEGDKSYTVTIVGGPAQDGQYLFATYKNNDGKYESLGKLNIYSYAPKKQDVYIVPVKDKQGNTLSFDINAVQEELQKTYGKIGVTFNISEKEPIAYGDWDKNGDNKLQVSGSGLFTQYTPEMKALNNAVAKAYGVEKDKLYLLLVNEGDAKEGSPHGDMPRNQQFGYLFNGYTPRTVAHEIGHGAFSLQHTFEKTYQVPENSTDNLMDYKGGNVLIKHQWDIIHSPGTVIQLWEGDDEGMILENCFDEHVNEQKFNKVKAKLKGMSIYNKVFKFINDESEILYCFKEKGPKNYVEVDKALGVTHKMNPYITIFMQSPYGKISFDDYFKKINTFSKENKLKYKGYIELKMDNVSPYVIFHELNHAAQFIIAQKDGVNYSEATLEVETRLILFYQAFINADEATRNDADKMKAFLEKFYNNQADDLLPFVGLLRYKKDIKNGKTYNYSIKGIERLLLDNGKNIEKVYYKHVYDLLIIPYFTAKLKDSFAQEGYFREYMKEYAKWIKEEFGYSYEPTEMRNGFYLFEKLVKK